MKRLMTALALLLFAAGCSTTEAPNPDDAQMESSSAAEQETEETTDSSSEETDLAPVPDEKFDSATLITDQADYPELEYIQETVPLENLDGYLVTDNPGTRVMIFVEADEQAYKSIFIKSENRLKLVDLRANELLLDEKLSE